LEAADELVLDAPEPLDVTVLGGDRGPLGTEKLLVGSGRWALVGHVGESSDELARAPAERCADLPRHMDEPGAVQTVVAMADHPTPTQPDENEPAGADAQQVQDAPAETTEPRAAEQSAAEEAPPSEAIIADATAPVGSAEAVEPPAEAQPPAAEQPAPPAAEAEHPTPAAEAEQSAPAAAAEQPAPPAADAEQPTPAADAEQPTPAAAEQSTPTDDSAGKPARGKGKPRRDRPRRDRGPKRDRPPRQPQQRASGPLPFQELRDAATAVIELFGARQALRDAFAALGEKERRDLARLVAEDGDWRVRARNIAAGSLGAGRVGKALAAQQISMSRVEDLWTLTLSKEEAAERQARIRNARRRDERRAQRDAERDQRSDRVSRADLEKAQDGRVGAQIRIVVGGTGRDRRRRVDEEEKDQPKQGSDLLDRLGY
jgi:hypothetical protein